MIAAGSQAGANRRALRAALVACIAIPALLNSQTTDLPEGAGLSYFLQLPDGWEEFLLGDVPLTANSLYVYRNDQSTRDFFKSHREKLVLFTGGETVSCAAFKDHVCLARLPDGREGWIRAELLVITPESSDLLNRERNKAAAAKAASDKAAAAKRAAADRAEAARRAAAAQAESEEIARKESEQHALRARCAALFRSTANKKVGDLTVVESRAVAACDALGYYKE